MSETINKPKMKAKNNKRDYYKEWVDAGNAVTRAIRNNAPTKEIEALKRNEEWARQVLAEKESDVKF